MKLEAMKSENDQKAKVFDYLTYDSNHVRFRQSLQGEEGHEIVITGNSKISSPQTWLRPSRSVRIRKNAARIERHTDIILAFLLLTYGVTSHKH